MTLKTSLNLAMAALLAVTLASPAAWRSRSS